VKPETSPIQCDLVQHWAEKTLALNTRIAYSRDWTDFTNWCTEHVRTSLPATPAVAALYIADFLGRGRKVTTAARRATSIAYYHRQAGLESPADTTVWSVITGARRERCERPVQKRPITVSDLHVMVAHLAGSPAFRTRNRAILLFGFASALRRASIASLDLADLEFQDRGVLVMVRHEKNDRIGRGRTLAVPFGSTELCPVRALEEWLELRGRQPGPLFTGIDRGKVTTNRLHPSRVGIVVQEAAESAGYDRREYGGHSMRAGFATESLALGVGEIRVAAQTGHRSLESLRRYYRPPDPFAGNPCGALGL